MKAIAITILLIVAAAAVVWSVQPGPDSQDIASTGQQQQPPPIPSNPIPTPIIRSVAVEPVPFTIDKTRLHDVSYLADSDLMAYADSLDVTPECVVKVARGEADMNQDVCTQVSIQRHVLRNESGFNYKKLTLVQLEAMAQSDAYANLEVGGYYINSGQPDKATEYFERAVALSGKATTIMYIRQTDVHPAVLHYELLLVAEALGRRPQDIQRDMVMNRLLAGQEAEAIQRAQERLERLTKMRQKLVGRPWGEP